MSSGTVVGHKGAAHGRIRKLQVGVVDNSLPLAPVTKNRINLQQLCADSEHLRSVLAPIMDAGVFIALFTEEPAQKRPLSRGMAQHAAALQSAGIAIPTSAVPPIDVLSAPYQCTVPVFLLAKKSGEGRFIADCRPINTSQQKPPPMGLPRIHDVIQTIGAWDVAAKCDGVGYFHQFPLAPSVSALIKIRLAGNRGDIHELHLASMPMGWSRSPYIAQSTSNFICRDVGVAWVDDFIIGGTMTEFEQRRALFQSRIQRYNIEVDHPDLQPSDRLMALGLEFDLVAKQFRIQERWVEDAVNKASLILSEGGSVREHMAMFGALIWASYIRDVPLWTYAEGLTVLSSLARCDDLEQSFECATEVIRGWIQDTKTNPWRPTCRVVDPVDWVFSDASSDMIAFLRVHHDIITHCEQHVRNDGEHIFLAELGALVLGHESAPERPTMFVTDNQPLNWVLHKGHSSSFLANVRLRAAFQRRRPRSCWIPTHLMPADRYTRGHTVPTPPCPIEVNDGIVEARRYVHALEGSTEIEANSLLQTSNGN